MYDVGQRVRIRATFEVGIVIGHVGPLTIVSLDGDPAENVLIRDNDAAILDRQQRARPVVVHPSGRASPLSRGDSRKPEGQRVKVR